MKRILSILIIFAVLLPNTLVRPRALNADPVIRVGLFYGSGALPSANLANEVGSGYNVGYFNDSASDFCTLYRIGNEKITVMKDKVIYIGSDSKYYDTKPATSLGTIQPYHLELDKCFESADDAGACSDNLTGKGYDSFIAYVNGEFRVRVGQFASESAANSSKDKIATASGYSVYPAGNSSTCYTITSTGTSDILFEFDNDGGYLAIRPLSDSAKAETWFKGYSYYGDFVYKRMNGNDITVVNVLPLNDYVKGVIPYEMSTSWPSEALKAQAICARSYAIRSMKKHNSSGFDVCNSTDCQVYRGTSSANAVSDDAVDSTYGMYAMYDGQVAQTFFHSSDGGSTESAVNVWGNDIPYLKAVKDNFEDLSSAKNGMWKFEFTLSKITSILKDKGYTNDNIVKAYIDKFTDAGNVYRICFQESSGKILPFEKERARLVLTSPAYGLYTYSPRYRILNVGDDSESAFESGAVSQASGTSELYVNGQSLGSSLNGIFAIGAGKQLKSLSQRSILYIKSKSGVSSVNLAGGTDDGGSDGFDTKSVTASGSGTFVISGRGWGHNVGMSQYGAKGMAQRGYGYDDIIKFYFTGVDIGSAG